MSELADLERSKRQKRATGGGSYDMFLKLVKWGLPLIVGALVAILVLAPLIKGDEVSFVLNKDDVDKAAERMRLTEALYRGEDNKGQAFSVKAGSAVQRTSKVPVVEMQNIAAAIILSDGATSIQAAQGSYNIDKEVVTVPGQLDFKSAGGYALSLSDVDIDLNTQAVTSEGDVSGTMPLGQFWGNMLRADLDRQTVNVDGGVRGTLPIGSYSADSLYADNKSRTVVLQGNAKLQIKQGAFKR